MRSLTLIVPQNRKNMKAYPFYLMIVIALFTACDKADKVEPVLFPDIEGNVINLEYPDVFLTKVTGVDKGYRVVSSHPDIVYVELIKIDSFYVSFGAIGVGDAQIFIVDKSDQPVYVLDVHVSYKRYTLVIQDVEVEIKGDDLTDTEKIEIEEKALATIPVQVNGGYELIFTNKKSRSGKLIFYEDTMGEGGKEGTYSITYKSYEGFFFEYEIDDTGEKREFMISRISPIDGSGIVEKRKFVEDITEQFKADYPNVESVLTFQISDSIDGLYYHFIATI